MGIMPRIVIATRQATFAGCFLGISFQRVYESEVNNERKETSISWSAFWQTNCYP